MTKADDAVKRVEAFLDLRNKRAEGSQENIASLVNDHNCVLHLKADNIRTILAELEGLRSKANISASVTEDVARAIWECNVDEVTFDEAKAANDGNGDAAYNFNMLMAQAAVWAVENHIKTQAAEIERLRKSLTEMITAIQDGNIDSPELGGHDDIPAHRWHEEWLYHAEQALKGGA
jgi:regulator of replication initiation timing